MSMLAAASIAVLCRFQRVQQGEQLPSDEVEARLTRIPQDIWNRLYR